MVPNTDQTETKKNPKILTKSEKVDFGLDFGGFGEIGLSRIGCREKGVKTHGVVYTRSRAERPLGEGFEHFGVKTLIFGDLKM